MELVPCLRLRFGRVITEQWTYHCISSTFLLRRYMILFPITHKYAANTTTAPVTTKHDESPPFDLQKVRLSLEAMTKNQSTPILTNVDRVIDGARIRTYVHACMCRLHPCVVRYVVRRLGRDKKRVCLFACMPQLTYVHHTHLVIHYTYSTQEIHTVHAICAAVSGTHALGKVPQDEGFIQFKSTIRTQSRNPTPQSNQHEPLPRPPRP